MMRTFEECLPEINIEIRKRRNKWTLTAINWMDYEDISQILRIHINKKWHLYDQTKPLPQWVNRIISNQISNLIRNNYYNFAKPCLKCPASQGENLCSWTPSRTQCTECPLYAKWNKYKKSAYDTKIPLSIEDHSQEISNKPDDFFDIEGPAKKLHKYMKSILKSNEWKVYEMIYLKHYTDEQAAIVMGFKTTEKNRAPGYKQIKNIKKSIIAKVKEVLYSDSSDIIMHS